MIQLSKLRFCIVVLVLSISLLTGCSEKKDENRQSNDISSENKVTVGKSQTQQTNLPDEKAVQEKVRELFKDESYKLIWNIEDKDAGDKVPVWNMKPVSENELWKKMKSQIFAEGKIQSTEKNAEAVTIQMLIDKSVVTIQLMESGIIKIQNLQDEDMYVKIADFLSKETGMACVKGAGRPDLDIQECYYFQINGISVDIEGYAKGVNWIPGSYYSIDAGGTITISNLVKKESKKEMIDPKQNISIPELKLLCELKWSSRNIDQVCVLNNMEPVYIISPEKTQLIPAFCLTGSFYDSETDSEYTTVLVDCITGEILRFI